MRRIPWLLVLLSALAGGLMGESPGLTGPYLGQQPPGATPKMFAPGTVCTDEHELNSVFSPDGREFYFTRRIGGRYTIVWMRMGADGKWSDPEPLAFCRQASGVDPALSTDGRHLYFGSGRAGTLGDSDIWRSDRTPDGWSEAVHLGDAVNSAGNENHPGLTADGTLYFHSGGHGGHGASDIFRCRLVNGRYGEPENLGEMINSSGGEFDPYVSPDEGMLIFSSSDRPDGFGAGDLYVSFRKKDGSWTRAVNLGAEINSPETDYCAKISPDGRYFFFSSRKRGNSDVYWVSADVVRRLKSAE